MNQVHEEHAAAMNTIATLMELLGVSDSLSISGQVAQLKDQCKALAAENGQMLRLLTDISDNHGEYVDEADEYLYASVPMDYVSEVNSYVSRDVNAENPFASTDRFLAELQAQGVEAFAEQIRTGTPASDLAKVLAIGFAQQLRVEKAE